MRHGRWIALAAGLVAALALVAPAGARAKAAASDKAILQAGVLTAADVPSTWTAKKQTDTGTKSYKGLTACKQIVSAITTARRGPKALSPEFSDPATTSNSFAQDTVYVFKNEKAATQFLSAYQSGNAQPCLEQTLKKALGAKAQTALATIGDLQGVGDDGVGYEASITTTTQAGQPLHVVDDIIGIRVGRVIIGFEFLNNDVRTPLGPTMVTTVVSRVRTATGG